jgi:hypothetical protein
MPANPKDIVASPLVSDRNKFLFAYEHELLHRYAWAGDEARLKRFMDGVRATVDGPDRIWIPEGAAVEAAWRAVTGRKGKPTLAGIRALSTTL